ncbi:MAG: branched-chain amino acid ABC transporter permease [Acidimicrobiales bacterium]
MQIVYYAFTLVFFFFVYCILNWGLNIQFGQAGILNFAYIAFVAIGAYITGVLTLHPAAAGSGQSYVLGLHLPFFIALLAGGVAAAVLGGLVGLIVFRRLRSDYLAIVMISLSLVMFDFITNYVPLFDGADGLSSIPEPFAGSFHLNPNNFIFVFAGFSALMMLVMWLIMSRVTRSPLGRTLRAIREDVDVAQAFGKNVFRYQMTAMLVGSFYAGIGGGLIIEFVSAFNTSAWATGETFVIFAALIIGGLGNNLGAILGSLIVPVIFVELPKFLPQIASNPALVPEIDNMIIGVLLILMLRFRPQGVVPERRERFERLLAGLPARLRQGQASSEPVSFGEVAPLEPGARES